jgi:flagellar motor switch protein FliN/FliY
MALDALEVEFSVILGKTQVPLHRLLRMGRGALIALDPAEEDSVEILANGLPVAHGRILVERGAIRVEVTDLIRRAEVTRTPGTSIGGLRGETARAQGL